MDGGENIRPATWESVSMMLQLVSDVQPGKQTQNHTTQPNHTGHMSYCCLCVSVCLFICQQDSQKVLNPFV